MRLDAHHHFWRFVPAEFGWIDDSSRVLRRDFLPAHLQPELAAAGIDGTIAVQARQSLVETEWLLELASQHAFIRGVVGWVPLASPDIGEHLGRLAAHPALKGVRHVVQDEPDAAFILRPDFNRGLRQLAAHRLAYDILIFPRHLAAATECVDRHPNQVFVLDHLAKPRICDGEIAEWSRQLRELARRPQVFAKISGLVTEAGPAGWTEAQLRPYLDAALEAFGPQRLMFGTDWPVCLLAAGYGQWTAFVQQWAAKLSRTEQEWLFGETARRAYRI